MKRGLLQAASGALVLTLAMIGLPSVAAPAPAWSLLPQPVHVQMSRSHSFAVANGASISARGRDRQQVLAIAGRFADLVARTRGLKLHVATADAPAAITFTVDPRADVDGDVGYRIVVDASGIHVTARTPEGAFYAAVTVWQLLTPPGFHAGTPAAVAAGVIDDHPRFAWRALLLDSGRHFQSVADIKQLIDWMSLHKLNVLLWHLTEDQGWRLEVPKYPKLTAIGACRKAVGLDIELTGSADKPYCGFYTEAEVRDVVRYAAARFVTIVPGIDMPGHSQAAIAAYPWLGVTGKQPQVWTDWGVSPWLLNPDERTLAFVNDVLDEVMHLFPSKYISIGGDEADKQQWNASPEVQAQMRKLGLANMDALQAWFTQRVAAYLVAHGRTPVGWDDELVAGATIPASEVVMSWHGNDGERVALKALQQGHDVVMTPQESLYFDHFQSQLPDEWPGPVPMVSLQQVYDTTVIPAGATVAQAQHILGVQAGLWTELMPTFARDQHAVFPRIAALSELAWSPAAAHGWDGFLARMPAELARYHALGIGYADSAFAPAFALAAAAPGALRVTLSNQTGIGVIRYTTDGSAPTVQSTRYVRPLVLTLRDNLMLRAAAFAPDGLPLSAPRTQLLDPGVLLRRAGNELAGCTAQADGARLGGAGSTRKGAPVYKVDLGNMCWRWPRVPLAGATQVALTVGRVAWRFGDDATGAVVRPQASAAGEFEVHADSCTGPLLARLPLQAAATARGETTLTANVSIPQGGYVRDLCIFATGDPRTGQWTLARIGFSKGSTRTSLGAR